MRTLTVSRVFLYRNTKHQNVEAPFIRVQGKWLESLGFTSGDKVEVFERQGEIIIRRMKGGCSYGKGQVHDQHRQGTAAHGEGEGAAGRTGRRQRRY